MVSPIRGVLFDIDDTLVDLRSAMWAALDVSLPLLAATDVDAARFRAVFEDFVRDPEEFYVAFLAGDLGFEEQRQRRILGAMSRAGVAVVDDPDLVAWDAAYRVAVAEHWAPISGVVGLLDELDARGIAYGAVSNNTYARQRAKLDGSGLERVAHLVGVDTVGAAKPDPEMFLEGCRLLGVQPGEALFVGDNWEADVLGAQAAGLQAVWFNPPEHVEGPDAAEAERVADRITEISQVLKLTGFIG